MVIPGQLTAGQLAFLLGIIPVFVAWIYGELLEYKKRHSPSKVHSDINIVNLGDGVAKEEEKVVLLEGGLQHAANPKAANSSTKSQLFRFVTMNEMFLMENRLTLRAIAEFGAILIYFYICDRTDVFGESEKSYNRDLFLFLYFLLIIVASITSLRKHSDKSPITGKSILYLNRHQTEEWKGWMQK